MKLFKIVLKASLEAAHGQLAFALRRNKVQVRFLLWRRQDDLHGIILVVAN
jgi:hypothetical protein